MHTYTNQAANKTSACLCWMPDARMVSNELCVRSQKYISYTFGLNVEKVVLVRFIRFSFTLFFLSYILRLFAPWKSVFVLWKSTDRWQSIVWFGLYTQCSKTVGFDHCYRAVEIKKIIFWWKIAMIVSECKLICAYSKLYRVF